ncbi:Rne/Rng family ribonuclease, partial [Actinacidiphila soli]|uniref:Rne/Rng family ribonuclease n=1 Tax=Actinacidiphila soli TaxID=2487275 RepID=UPI0013E34BAE
MLELNEPNEAPQNDATDNEQTAAPRRRRRAASRPAGPPAATAEVAAPDGSSAAAPAIPAVPEPVEAPAAGPVEPPKRRRATRKAAAPAAAPEESAETAEAAEAPAAPKRRRATRKTAAPEPVEAESVAAADAPAKALQEPEPEKRPAPAKRSRKRAAAPAASFLAEDDGSRRLKPGALAPKDNDQEEAPAPAAAAAPATAPASAEAAAEEAPVRARRTRKRAAASVEPVTYPAKAVRDGNGWAVEVENAFGIRGYGETVEEARAKAVEAVAEAFGVPATSVNVEVATAEQPEPQPQPQPEEEAPAPARGRRRVVRPPVAVFQPPVFQAPEAPAVPAAAPAAEAEEREEPEARDVREVREEHDDEEYGTGSRRRRRRRGAPAPAAEAVEEATDEAAEEAAEAEQAHDEHEDEGDERPSRRRRRGGRRRRRGEAPEGEEGSAAEDEESEDDEEAAEAEGDHDHEGAEDADEHGSVSSRRRRRRRRRGGDSAAEDGTGADDPERTVVKVREPRAAAARAGLEGGTGFDEVQSIKGSTRMEAKKQRRREGREQGRRRVPIITEAEFLARREAVERVMVVRETGDRTQIGVLEDDVLVEHYVNKEQATSYVGNVYLGKVQNVLPSMEAAFVDIGKGRNAVLYAGEVNFEALGMGHGPRRIESALKSGQSVLVQVTKDPIGHKGARLTSQVSLPGRYLVYVPEGSMTGISRKLPDTERARLKTILKKIVPEDAGVIVRTAAEGASEDELARDVERLQAQWEDIQKKTKTGNAPALLYGEPDMTVRVVRDIFNEDFSKVIVSGDTAWETIHGYVSHVAPDLTNRLQRWTSEVDVFATYRIDEQLLKALDRKVWLPSGGSLVIDKTEAMVVVDVNTGKFTGQGGNLEETVTRNNLEAAEEIVRQLRLRDLGGIVVIDFIDMVLESNRDLVMRRLLECLGRDRTKHQVAEVTSLGLVQMTRKRVGQGLLESFSETCVHCNGRGVIVHMDQATTTGGGGKRKRRRGAAEADEPLSAEAVEAAEIEEADAEADEVTELEPVAVAEADLVPALGGDEEWFGSPAEAEAAASRRSRRRVSRRATAPVSSPEPAPEAPAEIVVAASTPEPAPEPVAEPVAEAAPEPVPVAAAAPRVRRRATRKVTAP